jgi:hypothetical protein
MQIVEVTDFGVRSAVLRLTRRDTGPLVGLDRLASVRGAEWLTIFGLDQPRP